MCPSPCNHKRTTITEPHEGFRPHPLIDGFIKSPCRCRPDTNEPCRLLNEDKSNQFCSNCALLGKGDCKDPGTYTPKPIIRDKRIHDCQYRDCKNPTKGDYCRKHSNVVTQRKIAWEMDHPGEPIDKEWLHRPIDKLKSRCRKGKKWK